MVSVWSVSVAYRPSLIGFLCDLFGILFCLRHFSDPASLFACGRLGVASFGAHGVCLNMRYRCQ
ncbi:hypothetical protein DESC_370012 [Desulfosarcina cetonica]|nr:hypothetical protein DESC_370012 [Desulfosarcina cetonica]